MENNWYHHYYLEYVYILLQSFPISLFHNNNVRIKRHTSNLDTESSHCTVPTTPHLNPYDTTNTTVHVSLANFTPHYRHRLCHFCLPPFNNPIYYLYHDYQYIYKFISVRATSSVFYYFSFPFFSFSYEKVTYFSSAKGAKINLAYFL